MKIVTNPEQFRKNITDKVIFPILKDSKKSKNLEIGIYNFSIQSAPKRAFCAIFKAFIAS